MAKPCESKIIVNATALNQSGALSILKQFIENIPDDNHKWLVFIPEDVSLKIEKKNVRLEAILGVKPMHKRLLWDVFGLNRWLKKHNIDPVACISLQNTGFRVSKKNIPHFIYYHQSIPFYPYKWFPMKGKHRTLWFYKNIYPFFVKLFLHKDTTVFVQLDYIKKGFVERYNHPAEYVKVYTPSVAAVNNTVEPPVELSESLNLFYPATGHFYKNHQVLFDALKSIRKPTELYVTILVNQPDVVSTGIIPFESVCGMYRHCDALVFPSYIETFGLPLLEAALTGMPIITADLPYAHEVLKGYEGATFVPYDNPQAWAIAIDGVEKGRRFTPINISSRPGWPELFESILSNI